MWIAVSTHPSREMLAIDNLRRQGYDTYCPMVEKKIRHARTAQTVRRPLFPGYVFAWINEDVQGWRAIQSSFGVRHVVSFDARPARVPDRFIAALRAQEVDGVMPCAPLAATLPAGAAVLVKTGIFKDMVARVLFCRAQDRVLVMLDLLKRSVQVEIPADCLERA